MRRNWRSKLPLLIDEWRSKPPSLIVIFLGANDASFDNSYAVPLPEYAANLKEIVHAFQDAFDDSKILFVTPPAIDDAHLTWVGMWTNNRTSLYAKECQRAGSELQIPVLDLWTSLQGKENIYTDGIHLNLDGNVLVHKLLLAFIREQYPMMAPEALPNPYKQTRRG